MAPIEITRIAARHADGRKYRGGAAVSSMWRNAAAFQPMPYFATYAATKAFLLHYTPRALAVELEQRNRSTSWSWRHRYPLLRQGPAWRSPPSRRCIPRSCLAREVWPSATARFMSSPAPKYLASTAIRFCPAAVVTAAVETFMQKWK